MGAAVTNIDAISILDGLVDIGLEAEDRTITSCWVMADEHDDYDGPTVEEFNAECEAVFAAVNDAWGPADYDGPGVESQLQEFKEAAHLAFWRRGGVLALIAKQNGDGGRWQWLMLATRNSDR